MAPKRDSSNKDRTLASQPAAVMRLPGVPPAVDMPVPHEPGEPALRSAGAVRSRLEQVLLVARQMRQH
jgi:hypothetical protein